MKSTGIVRRIDDLGRVAIPIELRRMHNIHADDKVEFYNCGDNIALRKCKPEPWTTDELKGALIAAAKDAGKDPVDYLII